MILETHLVTIIMEEVTATKSKNPGPDCAGTLILYSHQHYKASMIIIFISQMQKLTLGEVKGLVSRVPCGWGDRGCSYVTVRLLSFVTKLMIL